MEQDTLKKVQEELSPWTAHNFPNRTPVLEPLLGIGEELGEIITAYLHRKMLQNIPFDRDDMLLYSQVYLSKIQHHLLKAMQGIRGDKQYHANQARENYVKLLFCLQKFMGDQATFYAATVPIKPDEIITLQLKDTIEDGIADLLVYTCNLGNDLNIDISKELYKCWSKVSKRDFQKNPYNGE